MGRDVGVPEAEEAVRLVVPPPMEAAQQLGRGGLAQPWGNSSILADSGWELLAQSDLGDLEVQ